ncbi:MAG: hypothetical protein HKN62_12120, partial [Phycisphaerales bacterium]|nr:hypothetical protein [Phycisphaerales bacterium]
MRGVSAMLDRVDPGWLFVIAGLAMGAATVLVPTANDLADLRHMLADLETQELRLSERLEAHARFLDDLERRDPTLLPRLAASQLNLLPEGEEALILVEHPSASVTEWIDASVAARTQPGAPTHPAFRATALSRLTDGPPRLWVIAASAVCVFAGLLLGPALPERASSRPGQSSRRSAGPALASRHRRRRVAVNSVSLPPAFDAGEASEREYAAAGAGPAAEPGGTDADANQSGVMNMTAQSTGMPHGESMHGVDEFSGLETIEMSDFSSAAIGPSDDDVMGPPDDDDVIVPPDDDVIAVESEAGDADEDDLDPREGTRYVDEDGDVHDEDEDDEDDPDADSDDGEEEYVYVDEDGNEIDA